jgi:hypothetical protein
MSEGLNMIWDTLDIFSGRNPQEPEGAREDMKKYTILGFEWFDGRLFNRIKQTEIVRDVPLRDDLANDLFDYEIESIKTHKTNFCALSMFNDRSAKKIREYDPENALNAEEYDAEYRVWCD